MSLNRKTPRETVKFFFKDDKARVVAFQELDKKYRDILFQKGSGASIIMNCTDSFIYDNHVVEAVHALGGHKMPKTA